VTSSFPRNPRREGLDLIRVLSMFAIIVFHLLEELFYSNTLPEEFLGTSVVYVTAYAWILSISGFTIVALSSFLAGHTKSKLGLLALSLIGAVTLPLLYFEPFPSSKPFGWDVYHFWIFSMLPVFALKPYLNRKLLFSLLGLGLALLFVPFWRLGLTQNISWRLVLLGTPEAEQLACVAWPLLPWCGLVFMGFALGSLTSDLKIQTAMREGFSRSEAAVWLTLLVLSAPLLGTYATTPIGPSFACHMYRQEPYLFCAHLVWILFSFRLAYTERVCRFVRRSMPFIPRMAWSKHFGISYLIQILLVVVLSNFSDETLAWPPLFIVLCLTAFLGPEFIFWIYRICRRKTKN
jgi:surface polysaccharide O-acyltransferase-like enzyme